MMKARLGTISTGLAARQRQIELGDIVLLLYVLSFVRQCFWQINHNAIAWTLTAIVGLGLWAIYLATRILRPVKYGKSFWLVVGVPLLFDTSYEWLFRICHSMFLVTTFFMRSALYAAVF